MNELLITVLFIPEINVHLQEHLGEYIKRHYQVIL